MQCFDIDKRLLFERLILNLMTLGRPEVMKMLPLTASNLRFRQ
jgi:hypothetical protein